MIYIDELYEYVKEYISERNKTVKYEDVKARLYELVDVTMDQFTWEIEE